MRNRTWVAALLLACVPPVAFLMLPAGPARILYSAVCVGSLVATGVLVRRRRPDWPLPWWLLVGGLALVSIRDVLLAPPSRGGLTGPLRAPTDGVLLFGGYLLLLLGTYALVRVRTRRRDRDSFIDGAVVAIGIAVVLWEGLSHAPHLQTTDGYFAGLTFAVLQSVLLAMTVRFIFADCAHLPAAIALFGAAVFGFAGNLAAFWTGDTTDPVPHTWVASLWLAAYLCVPLAAAHPSMRLVAMAATTSAPRVPIARMLLLSASLLVAPATVFLASVNDLRDAGGAAASGVLALLVVWRLFRLVAQREADRARQAAVVDLGHAALAGAEPAVLFQQAERLVHASLPPGACELTGPPEHRRLTVTPLAELETNEQLFVESLQQVLEAAVARREAEDAVRYLATHDPLTGLANRSLITDRLQQALHRAGRQDSVISVVFVDLDEFKDVNDLYGHNGGDAVLVAVARRLESALRRGDSVGRLAGDEFVLVCESVSTVTDAVGLAERILAAVCQPVELADGMATVAASIGIALASGTADSESALRAADSAMYNAKRQGANGYFVEPYGVGLER